ncbi:VPLPA-CTERM sorting domain-containing protein [Rubellimicrobium arenae]|uniref:VPLPA-CTERM sorting domain-containing protein n=1 Tax=Rubellimicrobium arenae TaxID=2817372 RepID=UPI001B30C6E2|nr:VPLPA-CTERM sorting domain-containing protein [Rubellimicrobium arenae]
MKLQALLSVLAVAAATSAHAVPVTWVDWDRNQTCDASGCTVLGTIGTGDHAVDVTYHTTSTGFAFLNSGADSETDYWESVGSGGSPYTSSGPKGNDNGPTDTDMIGLTQAGLHSFTFSAPVEDIYFAFVSANGNTFSFSSAIELLSSAGENVDGTGKDACGSWGCGTVSIQNGTDMVGGGEASGVVLMSGEFTTFSFTNEAEFWHGFTFGAAGWTDGSGGGEDPAPVPLPATGVLLLGGLGGLGALRRLRR